MTTFEDLRLNDLIKRFQNAVEMINSSRSLKSFNEAGKLLQDVYDFFITAESAYEELQETFKSLFSSFNYGAVIVNNAIKCGGLSSEDNELLGECIEIMLKCCNTISTALVK